MKELHIRIREEGSVLVTQLLQKPRADIFEQITPAKKLSNKKKTAANNNSSSEKVSSTFLFHKWNDPDIEARKLREAVLDRSGRYLLTEIY